MPGQILRKGESDIGTEEQFATERGPGNRSTWKVVSPGRHNRITRPGAIHGRAEFYSCQGSGKEIVAFHLDAVGRPTPYRILVKSSLIQIRLARSYKSFEDDVLTNGVTWLK
jgi:hypothetical protein